MSADYQLIAVSANDAEVRRMLLDGAWLAALSAEGFDLRTADVGAPVLVTVAALSRVEVTRVNAAARKKALNESASGPVAQLRAVALRCCDDVEGLIGWAGEPTYFGPWFIIESVDID